MEVMNERVEEWQDIDDTVKVVLLLDRACSDEAVGRAVAGCDRSVIQYACPVSKPRPGDIELYIGNPVTVD